MTLLVFSGCLPIYCPTFKHKALNSAKTSLFSEDSVIQIYFYELCFFLKVHISMLRKTNSSMNNDKYDYLLKKGSKQLKDFYINK